MLQPPLESANSGQARGGGALQLGRPRTGHHVPQERTTILGDRGHPRSTHVGAPSGLTPDGVWGCLGFFVGMAGWGGGCGALWNAAPARAHGATTGRSPTRTQHVQRSPSVGPFIIRRGRPKG